MFFTKSRDALAHQLPILPLYAFPPVSMSPQVIRRIKESGYPVLLVSPPLENPSVISRAGSDDEYCPMVSACEERPPHAGERDFLAPPCVAPQQVSWDLSEKVLNTITEARSPSTRHLYALKWSVLTGWCSARNLEPQLCDVSEILSFS